MGVPECGISNDKIDEATSVKVEILHMSCSGYTFKNKSRSKKTLCQNRNKIVYQREIEEYLDEVICIESTA